MFLQPLLHSSHEVKSLRAVWMTRHTNQVAQKPDFIGWYVQHAVNTVLTISLHLMEATIIAEMLWYLSVNFACILTTLSSFCLFSSNTDVFTFSTKVIVICIFSMSDIYVIFNIILLLLLYYILVHYFISYR